MEPVLTSIAASSLLDLPDGLPKNTRNKLQPRLRFRRAGRR
jgi:hypothetical protein